MRMENPIAHFQALTTNVASRRASIAQGQALLRLAIESFPLVPNTFRQTFIQLRREVRTV